MVLEKPKPHKIQTKSKQKSREKQAYNGMDDEIALEVLVYRKNLELFAGTV